MTIITLTLLRDKQAYYSKNLFHRYKQLKQFKQYLDNQGTVLKKCVSPYFSYLCIWKY